MFQMADVDAFNRPIPSLSPQYMSYYIHQGEWTVPPVS
jgi:hypothetical protein